MLPPGHVAAGLLTAEAVIRLVHPQLTPAQYRDLLWWGAVAGFLPDLDFFYVFFKVRSFTAPEEHLSKHRKLVSHRPLVWLAAGLLIYFIAPLPAGKMVGLILWLASWSHFILDSITDKIRWLWPFSQNYYGLTEAPEVVLSKQGFWSFWWKFLKEYYRTRWIIVWGEVLIIIIAIFQFHQLVIK